MMFFTAMDYKVPVAIFASWGRGHFIYTYDLKNWMQQANFTNPVTNYFYVSAYEPLSNRVIATGNAGPGLCATTPSGVIGFFNGRNSGNWTKFSSGLGTMNWATAANGSVFLGTTTYLYKVNPMTGAAVAYAVLASGVIKETVYDSVSGKYSISVGGTTYYTTDFSTFTASSPGFGASPNVNVIFNGPSGRIVVAGNITGSVGKVSTSDDGGVTWTNRTLPAPAGGGASIIYRGTYSSDLGMYFLGTGTGLTYYSYDGITWTQGSTLGSSVIRCMAYSPSLKVVYAIDALLNIWTTADGLNWTNMQTKLQRFATAGYDISHGVMAIR